MGMTITGHILAHAAGEKSVKPGDIIRVNVDVLLMHDVSALDAIGIFKREFGSDAKLFRRECLVIIPDRKFAANPDLAILREFFNEHDLPYFYDPSTTDYAGAWHEALPERGHCRPGEVLFGTDARTCMHGAFGLFASGISNTDAAFIMGTGKLPVIVPPSIRIELNGSLPEGVTAKDIIPRLIDDIGTDAACCALEFGGSAIEQLGLEERMAICDIAVEVGAKSGIVALDRKTLDYVKARSSKPFTCFFSDPNAEYQAVYTYRAEDFARPCPLDTCKICTGSCTDGIPEVSEAGGIFSYARQNGMM